MVVGFGRMNVTRLSGVVRRGILDSLQAMD